MELKQVHAHSAWGCISHTGGYFNPYGTYPLREECTVARVQIVSLGGNPGPCEPKQMIAAGGNLQEAHIFIWKGRA